MGQICTKCTDKGELLNINAGKAPQARNNKIKYQNPQRNKLNQTQDMSISNISSSIAESGIKGMNNTQLSIS